MKYKKNFKKTIWGYFEVDAETKEEADKKILNSEYDEFFDKCKLKYEDWEVA